jgi:hypothetical protein
VVADDLVGITVSLLPDEDCAVVVVEVLPLPLALPLALEDVWLVEDTVVVPEEPPVELCVEEVVDPKDIEEVDDVTEMTEDEEDTEEDEEDAEEDEEDAEEEVDEVDVVDCVIGMTSVLLLVPPAEAVEIAVELVPSP